MVAELEKINRSRELAGMMKEHKRAHKVWPTHREIRDGLDLKSDSQTTIIIRDAVRLGFVVEIEGRPNRKYEPVQGPLEVIEDICDLLKTLRGSLSESATR